MWWEVYRCDYDKDMRDVSEPVFIGEFKDFSAALRTFEDTINQYKTGVARAFIKVFKSKYSPEGELVCGFSTEWDDPMFNNDAV